jgi:hypothetical protein
VIIFAGIRTWDQAFHSINLGQVGLAAVVGLIPGGRATKAAVEALGGVLLKWLDAQNNVCEDYLFEQMMVDFSFSFATHLILGKVVDVVAKYGVQAVKQGLMKMGFDQTTVNKALKQFDEGTGSTPNVCSFSGDTLVLTKEGLRSISQLRPGDIVFAYNEATGEFGWYPITAVWAHQDETIIYLIINGELILTTPDHPFFTDTLEQIPAGQLQVGDRIWQGVLGSGMVEAVVVVSQPQLMYNLSVDEAHTFFVGQGRWLVHNACRPPKLVIHYTSKRNYQKIVDDKFVLKPSPAEGLTTAPAPQGVYFGDAEPPLPGYPYDPAAVRAQWGVPGREAPDHFIMIDTTKLPQGTTWASRLWNHNQGRPEWILESSGPINVSSAVVGHGHIDALNK